MTGNASRMPTTIITRIASNSIQRNRDRRFVVMPCEFLPRSIAINTYSAGTNVNRAILARLGSPVKRQGNRTKNVPRRGDFRNSWRAPGSNLLDHPNPEISHAQVAKFLTLAHTEVSGSGRGFLMSHCACEISSTVSLWVFSGAFLTATCDAVL